MAKRLILIVTTMSMIIGVSSLGFLLVAVGEKIEPFNPNPNNSHYTDFSGFEKDMGSSYITSIKTAANITMLITTGSFTSPQYTIYILTFGEITNITEFELEVSFDYYYTGTMLSNILVAAGSYYLENGSYSGMNNPICMVGIQDAWLYSGGVFLTTAYPNDVIDHHISSHGSIANNGRYTVYIKRTDELLICAILEDSIERFKNHWSVKDGLTRKINFVSVNFGAEAYYTKESFVDFNTLDLELNPLEETPVIAITIPTITILFSLASVLIVVLNKLKKKHH